MYHMGHGHERDMGWSSWERYGKKEREGTRKEKDKKIKINNNNNNIKCKMQNRKN